jgi:pyruvate dehydrogenase E1 component
MGADGFGVSDAVPNLRHHFEINAQYIIKTVITRYVNKGDLKPNALEKLNTLFEFDNNKNNPAHFQ